MKKAIILCIFSLLLACENEPTKPRLPDTGEIFIVIENPTTVKNSVSDSLTSSEKTTAPVINQLEVRILKSDNSLITSKTLLPVLGYFEGTIKVKAQDNLKVLCIGKLDGVVKRFGQEEGVDIKAGKTTTVTIPGSQWNVSSIPVITDISPNPSVDGSYTVIWATVPIGSIFTLQEANNQNFSDGRSVYTGTETQKVLSNKTDGTYYYRIMASNEFNVSSGWSDSKSVIVNSSVTLFTISGTIAGGNGATVTLNGDTSDTQIAGVDGSYSFTVEQGGTYTITPTKTDYSISPESQTFTDVTSDVTAHFTASYSPNTYTISGTVTGADSVLVTLSGDTSESQTVDDGGSYSFAVNEGGNYTITPSKYGYTFTPESQTFNNVTSNQTQNFTATLNTYTISGRVWGADYITVTLSGDKEQSLAVDDGRSFSFTVVHGGSYTITPSKTSYTFIPASRTFSNVTSNQVQNFTADAITYTISGTVSGADGVIVALDGDADSQVVNDGDSYSFTVVHGGSYTITPSKFRYSFEPASQTFNNVISDQSQDFVGRLLSGEFPSRLKLVSIPGDTFQMGDVENYNSDSDEKPIHTVTLSSFEMSIYEVTNQQYTFYLNSAKASGDITLSGSIVKGASGDYNGKEYLNLSDNDLEISYEYGTFKVDFGKLYRPVVHVTWFGAKAFALYYGLDLPTEAEWECGARGGKQYMYGTDDGTLSSSNANYNNNVGHTTDVGSYLPNPFGLYDMSGNMSEWCHDWYGPYSADSVTNPTGPFMGISRVLRSSTFFYHSQYCRSADRRGYDPYAGGNFMGFRVVHRPGGVTY